MSEAVDTRVVEAKFDSAQFEKGVDRTVKKLDELKKSLNLEEAGKSVADLASKTSEATEKASGALEKLENRFTSFAGMLKQKLLSGIADEIVGAFFKIKNGIESTIASLSSAQVSVGMSKYEQMLTSVRTMVSSGVSETAAYNAIETLGAYADQTSYSLDQMTSALSKMKAAGVSLEEGTKAVEGISNACANAGINAMDASRAFYNLSQAYSSGYLKYTDYRSLELLNMTTEDFKKNMLEAAVAAGTLQKVSEGVYKTINKNDKKVTAGKTVNIKNLSDSLRYNFMNTEALNKLFGEKYFFDEDAWKAVQEQFKDIEDKDKRREAALAKAKELYGETAVNAYFAAREARSFTDVLNTLKDVISRGWSTSFELIFGRLEEAKDFFTWLTESEFANAIYRISEFRNTILQTWKDRGGRDDLIAALKKIDDLFGGFIQKFGIFNDSTYEKKAQVIGANLKAMSRDFRESINNLEKWLNAVDKDGVKRIDRIGQTIQALGTIIGNISAMFGNLFKNGLNVFFTLLSNAFELLSPVIITFLNNLNKIALTVAEFIVPNEKDPNNIFTQLHNGIANIMAIAKPFIPVIQTIINVLGEVASFFVGIATSTFAANLSFISDSLGLIIELFGGESAQKAAGNGVWEGMVKDIQELGQVCKDALAAVGAFFTTLFDDLRKLLGISKEEGAEEGGFFDGIKNFFKTNKFIQNIKKWFKDIPKKIRGLFWKDGFSQMVYDQMAMNNPKGAEEYKNSFKGPLRKIWEGISSAIKEWVKTIPEKIKGIWNGILDLFFGKKQMVDKVENGEVKQVEERVKEGFSLWLDNTINAIKNWIMGIPEKVKELWSRIMAFFFGEDAVVAVEHHANPKGMKTVTEHVESGFSRWIKSLVTSVKTWYNDTFKPFIKNIWDSVIGFIFGYDEVTGYEVDQKNKVHIVTEHVRSGLVDWLGDIYTKISNWFKEQDFIGKLKDVWNKVLDFVLGPQQEVTYTNPETNETDTQVVRVKEGFSLWLDNMIKKAKGWATKWRDRATELWGIMISAIFGTNKQASKELDSGMSSGLNISHKKGWQKDIPIYVYGLEDSIASHEDGILDDIRTFAAKLGEKIGKIISNIPTYIAGSIKFTTDLFDIALTNVKTWIESLNLQEKQNEIAKDIQAIVEANETGDTSNLSPFATKILEIGQNIKKLITETIPGILEGAWTFISSNATNLWDAIQAIFDLEGPFGDWSKKLTNKAQTIGDEIRKAILAIPGIVKSAIEGIKSIFTNTHGGGYSPTEDAIIAQFTNANGDIIDSRELAKAVNDSADQIKKEKEGWSIWGVISDIGTSIGEAFVELGPTIIGGLTKAVEWIGNGLKKITSFLSDKPDEVGIVEYIDQQMGTDENAQQYSAIWESARTLGQTFKSVFTEVLPSFFEEAFKEIVSGIPRTINSIFGGQEVQNEVSEATEEQVEDMYDKVAANIRNAEAQMASVGFNVMSGSYKLDENGEFEKAGKTTKDLKDVAIDTADNINGILGALTSLATSDQGKTIALLLVVKLVLGEVREIFSLSETLESAAKAAKWEAIKAAIYFVVGLVSYLVVLASTGSTDQLNAVYDMFNKISGFAEKLGMLLTALMSISTVGKGFKALGNVFGSGAGDALQGIGAGFGYGSAKFLGGAAIVTTGASMITESIQNWAGDIATSFGYVATGFNSLSEAFDSLSEIQQKIDDATKTLGPIKDFMISLRHLFEEEKTTLTPTDEEKTYTEDFRGEIEQMTSTFTQLSGAIANFKTALSGDNVHAAEITKALNDIMGMETQMKQFAAFSETEDFANFKYAISSLSAALSAYSGSGYVSLNDTVVDEALDAVLKIIQNEKILAFAQGLNTIGEELPEAKEVYAQSEKLVMLATSIGSIGNAAQTITSSTGKNIEKLFNSITSITFEKYDDEGTDNLTKFANNFGVIGNAIGTFASETRDLSTDNIANAREAINMTIDLMRSLGTYSQGVLDKVFNGDQSIEQFGTNFQTFASGIKTGLDTLAAPGVSYDGTGLEQALKAIRSIVVSYAQLSVTSKDLIKTNFGDVANGLSGERGLAKALSEFMIEVAGDNAPKITDEDFRQINHALDLITLLGRFAEESNGVGFSTEMSDLVAGLNDHKPLQAIAQVMTDVRTIAQEASYDDKMPALLKSFGDLLTGLASLAQFTKNAYNSDANRWYIADLVANIADVFKGLHTSFEDIQRFFEDVDTFDMSVIEKAQSLFGGIRDLGQALNYFSNSKIFSGINNLKLFDWNEFMESLNTAMLSTVESENKIMTPKITPVLNVDWTEFIEELRDLMAIAFEGENGEDALKPKITPVLELTPEFVNAANDMRSMLGVDQKITRMEDNSGWFIPADYTSQLAAQIQTPVTLIDDISEIKATLNDSKGIMEKFNTSLGSIHFSIVGQNLVDTIWPDIDAKIGYEMLTNRVD